MSLPDVPRNCTAAAGLAVAFAPLFAVVQESISMRGASNSLPAAGAAVCSAANIVPRPLSRTCFLPSAVNDPIVPCIRSPDSSSSGRSRASGGLPTGSP